MSQAAAAVAAGSAGELSCAAEPVQATEASPVAPISIEILVNGGKTAGRYVRSGTNEDAETAVVGKGGFGTAYLYTRDGAFTPENSCEILAPGVSSPDQSPASVTESRLQGFAEAVGESASQPSKSTSSRLRQFRARDSVAPSTVVVKLCRTPCTGSFDELQKTSVVDRRERRTMMRDPSLSHIRVVRGEGRILRYLQAALAVEPEQEGPNLVKLLANLPLHGKQRPHDDSCPLTSIEVEPDFSEGPPARLLVFERLVELDFELTANGWEKSKAVWSVDKVEQMAFEALQGLRFLHRHNITHGDFKPSNLMRDAVTGCVKIIDLGASRRFVEVSNRFKDSTLAVDQGDMEVLGQGRARARLSLSLCEGLSSLTGSPHYMAPEILLQASRYADYKGRARSVLEDWEPHYQEFFDANERRYFETALNDLKRGWGIRADIWSWSCTVLALFFKTVEAAERPSSASICPFDFSFSKHQDNFVEALHKLAPEEQNQPRFHLWSRHFPLYIVERTLKGIELPECLASATPELQTMLRACFSHQDQRPTADVVYEVLTHRRRALHDLRFDGHPYNEAVQVGRGGRGWAGDGREQSLNATRFPAAAVYGRPVTSAGVYADLSGRFRPSSSFYSAHHETAAVARLEDTRYGDVAAESKMRGPDPANSIAVPQPALHASPRRSAMEQESPLLLSDRLPGAARYHESALTSFSPLDTHRGAELGTVRHGGSRPATAHTNRFAFLSYSSEVNHTMGAGPGPQTSRYVDGTHFDMQLVAEPIEMLDDGGSETLSHREMEAESRPRIPARARTDSALSLSRVPGDRMQGSLLPDLHATNDILSRLAAAGTQQPKRAWGWETGGSSMNFSSGGGRSTSVYASNATAAAADSCVAMRSTSVDGGGWRDYGRDAGGGERAAKQPRSATEGMTWIHAIRDTEEEAARRAEAASRPRKSLSRWLRWAVASRTLAPRRK